MLAHTWLDFFLSTAPSALLLLLLWASSICCTFTVLGLSCHSWLDILLPPPASTASQGIPHLHSNLVFPSSATLPVSPSDFSEDLLRLYALGISSSSRISQSRYCALVREAWDANNVFCLRYGMRNQENQLLSCFCHRPVRKLGKPGQKSFILCNFDKAYKYSLQDRRAFTSPSANAALDSFE